MAGERLDCPKCKAPLESHEPVPGVSVNHCPGCSGVMYDAETLAVPLSLVGLKPARWDCPRCRRPMETGTAFDGGIEVDRCVACGALWFDAGEILVMRRLTGVEDLVRRKGEPMREAGPAAPAPAPSASVPKSERLVDIPKAKKRSDSSEPLPPEMTGVRNDDMSRAPTVELDGRTYQHFQTSVPVTTAVYGEFPWIATVGDAARMRDFVCPPYLLSQEVTSTESVWTAGEYVEPEEIWAAFAQPGAPPAKVGVAPAQPNPWGSQMLGVWSCFALATAVCFGVYMLLSAAPNPGEAWRGNFDVTATDAEKSRVSPVFALGGRTTNAQILIGSNVDQHWAHIGMALINADTDVALDFGEDVSAYSGVEDGEAWSEGSRYATVTLPAVPPGNYYLRIEPETDAPELSLSVAVKRGDPLLRLPVLSVLLLLLPALFGAIRSESFESSRWLESDHPRPTGEDWEDDD